MSELLREIEEDIRAERMQRLWDRFGKTMIRVSIAVIIGTALGVAWQHYQKSQAAERTSQLLAGIEKMNAGDSDGAIALFDEVAKSDSVHADMALVQKGRALQAKGDAEGAQKIYAELAARNSRSAFVDLGKLLAAGEKDEPVTVDDKAPLAMLASEMRGWQLLKAGKKDEAVKLFAALRDNQAAPQTQRARMAMALSTLAPESMEQGVE